MTATLLARHTVETPATLSRLRPTRSEPPPARLRGHRVLHDGNQVTTLIDFADHPSVEDFVSEPALAR
jgi:hypothetical protein